MKKAECANLLCHKTLSDVKPIVYKKQSTCRYMQCISKCNNVISSIMLGITLAMVSGLKYTKYGYLFGCDTMKNVHKHVQDEVISPMKEKWRNLQLSPVSGRHGISSCVRDTVRLAGSGSQAKTQSDFEAVETEAIGARHVKTQSSLKKKTNGRISDGPLNWVPCYKPGITENGKKVRTPTTTLAKDTMPAAPAMGSREHSPDGGHSQNEGPSPVGAGPSLIARPPDTSAQADPSARPLQPEPGGPRRTSPLHRPLLLAMKIATKFLSTVSVTAAVKKSCHCISV